MKNIICPKCKTDQETYEIDGKIHCQRCKSIAIPVKEYKEVKVGKINHIDQNATTMSFSKRTSEREREKEKAWQNKIPISQLSLRRYHFKHFNRTHRLPSRKFLLKLGDRLILQARMETAQTMAQLLNYQIKRRDLITDYQRRQLPSIRIGKYSYYLTRVLD